jgi:type VI secretion system protein ImpE
MTQLELCGEMDHGTLAMVNTYREGLKCEGLREAVFAGKTTPMVFGQPQEWVALLVQALEIDAQGQSGAAAQLRQRAFDAAPTTAGTLNGEAFDWIADADSRLGPVLEAVINGRYSWVPFSALAKITLEAPTDLRDLVWTPAHLEFPNGGASVALVPTRYVATTQETDGALLMARKTEWVEIAPEQFKGLGQRVFSTSGVELGVLEAREVVFQQS